MSTAASAAPKTNLLVAIARDYRDGLKSLTTCPREIWITYLVKILESLCYFSSVLILMPFLLQDMGLNEVQAGTVFGLFSASMSLFMFFVGFVADSLGIKKALLVGLVIALVGRAAITFTTAPAIVYPGLAVLSVGFAYMIPLLPAAIKSYTTRKAQKYAYSWYYVVMNVGSLIAGLSLDGLRGTFTQPIPFQLFGLDLAIRPLQMIFLVGLLATVVSLVLVLFFVRERIPASAFKEDVGDSEPAAAPETAPATEAPQGRRSVLQVIKEVTGEKRFWIFITFMLLLVLVKMIFQYNHSLYPVYMDRIGLTEWTGKLYAINPALIILLVPVITAATSKMKAYDAIIIGTFVSAGSVLVLGLGESIVFIVAFQVILSLGEALWSPRLYDYTATIAPKGKESSYMAYTKAPMFLAKVGAGPVTGILLASLCPAEGARNTELMWIIVGLSTLVSPVALLVFRRWLDVERREAARTDVEAPPAAGPSAAA